MNEREELQRAREELKSSIKVVQKNLKIFGKAVVSSQKAALRNVGNNIINTYKQLQSDIYIHKLNKEIARYQKEREAAIKRAKALEEANRRARDREHTRVLKAEARRIKNQEREERVLKFKNGVKQKTSSLKSRIGKVKNSFLRTLSSKNIDVKLRDAFDKVGIVGLTVLGSGLTMVNRGKERITDFTSSQIAKLAEYRLRRQEEAEIRARDREHTRVLEAEARRIKNQEREERVLKFKNGVKQKTSSLKSRIGKVKNSFLRTLSSKNIDVKLRDAFDKVGIVGLTVLGSGLTMVNRGKERITDFTSSQIAKLAEYRLRRQEEAEIRANIMRYKNALDREIYNNRHNVYTSKKEELKRALLEERNRLLNIQSEELGDKPKAR